MCRVEPGTPSKIFGVGFYKKRYAPQNEARDLDKPVGRDAKRVEWIFVCLPLVLKNTTDSLIYCGVDFAVPVRQ